MTNNSRQDSNPLRISIRSSSDVSEKCTVSAMAVSKEASLRVRASPTVAFGGKFGGKYFSNFKRICSKQ